MKQIVAQFNFPNVSLQQYDAMWNDLRATGNAHPKGLISHVGAATGDGGLCVIDIWESQAAFDEFGKTLMALLANQNIPMVQPKILMAHYVLVEGQFETQKWPDELIENF